ncbi:MAG: hypothetical protein FJ318_06950, partial [SAR202 cluster bacterium]|nr:hypothetical protein [SAR202 cluster bacterium]
GNRVVRADDGNAKNFLCTYHGWTFGNDGRLEYVPGEQEAYYGALNKEELGLVEARVDAYAGIIFACWDKKAPTLEAYIGDARWYLDTLFNRRDNGMIAYGPQKWMEPVNWKTPVDNCSDNYHVPISHHSSTVVRNKFLGAQLTTMAGQLKHPNQNHHVFVNGHSITFRVNETDEPRPNRVNKHNREYMERYHRESMPEVERRLGHYRAHRIMLSNHSIFPHGVLGFRLALPRGPLMTEFWHFEVFEKDIAEEVRHVMLRYGGGNNGASGLNEQDDIDNWRSVTEASKIPIAWRKYPALVNMGAGHAGPHDIWPGEVSDRYISENNQRHFYKRWQEFMNADSWADIGIEPITAKYEGDAGMGR